MQQLVFALQSAPAPTFETFVTGRNREVVMALMAFAQDAQTERSLYLWGSPGSGKTHLLSSTIALARQCNDIALMRFSSKSSAGPLDDIAANALIVIDDAEQLNAETQIQLFNAYNVARERGARVLAAGALPPAQLPLRADVNTRLAWGLVYQLQALSDEEKVEALKQRARERGFDFPEDVVTYLIRHGRRDLPWLMAVLEALDQHSLATHRAITVPLLREVLDRADSQKNSVAS